MLSKNFHGGFMKAKPMHLEQFFVRVTENDKVVKYLVI